MDRASLGIAGVTLTACALLGSPGATQPALAAPTSRIASITASAATHPALPVGPRSRTPKNGGSRPVFTVDESAQHAVSNRLHQAASLAGYASASDGIAASGVIAWVDTPAQLAGAIQSRRARAPPTTRLAECLRANSDPGWDGPKAVPSASVGGRLPDGSPARAPVRLIQSPQAARNKSHQARRRFDPPGESVCSEPSCVMALREYAGLASGAAMRGSRWICSPGATTKSSS